jgi:hypothetical protein
MGGVDCCVLVGGWGGGVSVCECVCNVSVCVFIYTFIIRVNNPFQNIYTDLCSDLCLRGYMTYIHPYSSIFIHIRPYIST